MKGKVSSVRRESLDRRKYFFPATEATRDQHQINLLKPVSDGLLTVIRDTFYEELKNANPAQSLVSAPRASPSFNSLGHNYKKQEQRQRSAVYLTVSGRGISLMNSTYRCHPVLNPAAPCKICVKIAC